MAEQEKRIHAIEFPKDLLVKEEIEERVKLQNDGTPIEEDELVRLLAKAMVSINSWDFEQIITFTEMNSDAIFEQSKLISELESRLEKLETKRSAK